MRFHEKMSTFWNGTQNLQEPQKLAQKSRGFEKRRNGIVKTVEGRDKRQSESVKVENQKSQNEFLRGWKVPFSGI